mgnify:CR=1
MSQFLQKLKCCFNPWVIGGLAVVGFFLYRSGGLNALSLPILLALICPLSMVAMMFMMKRSSGDSCHKDKSTGSNTDAKQVEDKKSI